MADTYDLIVLGSGPGGYVAAIRAAQLGLKTAIVERELLGGICLNWGCIPTKALLRSAEIYHYLQHADAYGLSNDKPSFDIAKVVARSRAVAKQLNQGVAHLMKKNKITVVMGEGTLTAKDKLSVKGADGKTTELAGQAHHRRHRRAGPRPAVRQGRRQAHLDLSPRDDPARNADRAVGHRLGRDRDRVRELLRRPRRQGDGGRDARPRRSGRGRRGQRPARQEPAEAGPDHPHQRRASRASRPTPRASRRRSRPATASPPSSASATCIVAVGIAPNTENIGLEPLGVKTTKGHIDTDPYGRTNVAGLWAIGDVTAPPWLAHKAMHEAVTTAEAIAQALGNKDVHPHAADPKNIPGLHLLPPAGRERRPDRSRGQGEGL